jgi:hypothetical protein
MLVEDLLSLPVGTRVFGRIEPGTWLPGVIALLDEGCHHIRWDDGYSTIPLGKVREYDEYIASHTRLRPSPYERVLDDPDEQTETTEIFTSARSR